MAAKSGAANRLRPPALLSPAVAGSVLALLALGLAGISGAAETSGATETAGAAGASRAPEASGTEEASGAPGASGTAGASTWNLDRVLDAVRATEPGVLAARARAKAGAADAGTPYGAWTPRLSLQATLTRSDDPALLFSQRLWQGRFAQQDFSLDQLNRPDPRSAFQWGLVVEQPLWNGGAEITGGALSGHARGAADASGTAEVAARLLEAVDAYVAAFHARAAVDAESTACASAEEHHHVSRDLLRMGQVAELDTFRTRARLEEARAAWLGARADLGLALARLSSLAGASVAATDLAAPPADLSDRAPGDRAPGDRASGQGPDGRGELRAAREAAAAATLVARQAGFRLLPSINSRLAVSGYRDTGAGPSQARWMAELRMELPLWDGGRLLSERRAARARADQARAQAEMLERMLSREVQAAAAAARLSPARRDAARAARAAAEAALHLASRRYRSGLLPMSELLSADAEASRARLAESDADAGATLAHYRYLYAMGELR